MPEPLICPQCGTANPPGAASCFSCGWAPPAASAPAAPQPLICPRCGTANPPTAVSCANCGWAPPPAAGAAATGRRRSRTPIIVGSILGGALVLGVAVALVLQLVVHHPSGEPAAADSTQPATHAPTSATKEKSTAGPTSSSPGDYKALYRKAKSGVYKVVATGCGHDGTKIGTAFLIGKDRAVASYASLARASVVALTRGKTTVSATVDGVDTGSGLVMLKLDHTVRGHHFSMADDKPKKDDPVGLVGIPAKQNSPALRESKIATTKTSTRVGHTKIKGLAQVGVKQDPGLSGAPALNNKGQVAGMALASRSAQKMAVVPGPVVERNRSADESMPGTGCGNPRGPEMTHIAGHAPGKIKSTLRDYFEGINTGDYRQAYDQLSGTTQGGFSKTAREWRSTYDFNVSVHDAAGRNAYVSFTSISNQAKSPDKQRTCAQWDIDYHFAESGGELLIDHVSKHAGHSDFWSSC